MCYYELVTMQCHCWTCVFAFESPLLSLWGSEYIFSLCSVNLSRSEILFLLPLLPIFVTSSVLPSMQGSHSLFSAILDTPPPAFAPAAAKPVLSYTFIHTYTWKKATHLLRRKFHKGLIISFCCVSISPVNPIPLHPFWSTAGCGRGSIWIYAVQV